MTFCSSKPILLSQSRVREMSRRKTMGHHLSTIKDWCPSPLSSKSCCARPSLRTFYPPWTQLPLCAKIDMESASSQLGSNLRWQLARSLNPGEISKIKRVKFPVVPAKPPHLSCHCCQTLATSTWCPLIIRPPPLPAKSNWESRCHKETKSGRNAPWLIWGSTGSRCISSSLTLLTIWHQAFQLRYCRLKLYRQYRSSSSRRRNITIKFQTKS